MVPHPVWVNSRRRCPGQVRELSAPFAISLSLLGRAIPRHHRGFPDSSFTLRRDHPPRSWLYHNQRGYHRRDELRHFGVQVSQAENYRNQITRGRSVLAVKAVDVHLFAGKAAMQRYKHVLTRSSVVHHCVQRNILLTARSYEGISTSTKRWQSHELCPSPYPRSKHNFVADS